MSPVGGLTSLAAAGARPAGVTLSWVLRLLRLQAGSVFSSVAASPSPLLQEVGMASGQGSRLAGSSSRAWVPACPRAPRSVCRVLNYDVPPEGTC